MLKPLAVEKWNYAAAAHLLNRAGFGGPPAEIECLVKLGPEQAVSQLVDFEKIPDNTPDPEWAKPDPDKVARLQAILQAGEEERRQMQREEKRIQREWITELRGWWLQRMAKGPRPLQEKMTLFWHGHFATSFEKVLDAYLMWRQNELFRRLAVGNWQELLIEAGKDPAMLIWLDQAQSRRQRPNENFAREVMELFALGEGHYTEKDITEAARALTGWTLDQSRQKFVDQPMAHDDGVKTVFSKTGNFDGEEVLKLIVAQPQAGHFITAKLWHYFAGEMPAANLNAALATLFREKGNNFKPVLRAMFRSEEFYAPALMRNQVKSPVQWLVGTVRMLEGELPPALACEAMTRNLGQDLFAPPNVKGWDGGLTWITTNNLFTRYNYAAALVQGDMSTMAAFYFGNNPNMARMVSNRLQNAWPARVDVEKIFTERERTDKPALIAALEQRLLQSKLKLKQEQALRDYLYSQGELDEGDILGAIRLVMSTPEYQLT